MLTTTPGTRDAGAENNPYLCRACGGQGSTVYVYFASKDGGPAKRYEQIRCVFCSATWDEEVDLRGG